MNRLRSIRDRLRLSHTRALLWLEVSEQDRADSLVSLLRELGYDPAAGVLIGSESLASVPQVNPPEALRLLGSTFEFAVIDAFSGFNPNAVAQIAGCIAGGGVLILLTPSATDWPQFRDPEYQKLGYGADESPNRGAFLKWLIRALSSDTRVIRLSHRPQLPEAWPSGHRPKVPWPYLSTDQGRAVKRLISLWSRPCSTTLLTADRGRGKSAALGIALATQASFPVDSVLLCAPQRSAVDSLCSIYQYLQSCAASPRFLRPAELLTAFIKSPRKPRLLIIDEAAGIPTPVLRRLSALTDHLVLSTTLHGYEGHGSGFALRFLDRLSTGRGRYESISLQQPIRWAEADPLESSTNRLLLMDQEPDLADERGEQGTEIEYSAVDPSQLSDQPARLAAVFALLSQAHYRTSPSDLRILLDSLHQRLWLAEQEGRVVGVLWSADEAISDPALAQAVLAGRRRPPGNLLPQTLLYHEGWSEASLFRFERVVRIAVLEPLRHQGVGRELLRHLQEAAQARSTDLLGTSFALYASVAQFWVASGYRPVRLGEQLDSVAASPALVMLKPLSPQAVAWFSEAESQFAQRLEFNPCELEPEARTWLRQCVVSVQLVSHLDQSLRDRTLLTRFSDSAAPLGLIRPALARGVASWSLNPEQTELVKKALTGPLSRSELAALRRLVATVL